MTNLNSSNGVHITIQQEPSSGFLEKMMGLLKRGGEDASLESKSSTPDSPDGPPPNRPVTKSRPYLTTKAVSEQSFFAQVYDQLDTIVYPQWAWIEDLMYADGTPVDVVYEVGNKLYRAPVTVSGTDVTVGTPVEVEKTYEVKALPPDTRAKNQAMIFKQDDGTYAFIGVYSNNYRDNDRPAEIISAKSHKDFTRKANAGKCPMPELWLAHEANYKVGQVDYLDYDETDDGAVFAVAFGHFDPGMEALAEELMGKSLTMSHGMPTNTIQRNKADSTIIEQHESREITILAPGYEANPLTSFSVSGETSDKMSLSAREKIQSILGLSDSVLDAVEAQNSAKGKAADAGGVERKSAPVEKEAESPAAEEPVVTPDASVVEAPITREEILEMVTEVETNGPQAQALVEMSQRIDELFNSIKALTDSTTQSNKSRAEEVLDTLSPATLKGLLYERSIIGKPEAQVDGRSTLAKDAPKPAEPDHLLDI